MIRIVFATFAIAIAGNFLAEAQDPLRKFLKLNADVDYQLVVPELTNEGARGKRDSEYRQGPIRIRAFEKDIKLWIYSKDCILLSNMTPVYFANYSSCAPGGVYFAKTDGLMGKIGKLFEDPSLLASLLLGKDYYGRVTINGHIMSENLVVRSVPDSIVEAHKAYRRRRSMDDPISSEPRPDMAHHVVYRSDFSPEREYALNFNTKRVRRGYFSKLVPKTIYPKILLYLDNQVYVQHGMDVIEILKYYAITMNGVELLYRGVESPNIRFHIVSIVIATDPQGAPFITNYLDGNGFSIDSKGALNNLAEFAVKIAETFPVDSYSMALAMTGYALSADNVRNGMTKVDAICDPMYTEGKIKQVRNVAVVRDTMTRRLTAVFTAGRSIGLMFGASIDPLDETSICSAKYGFIMEEDINHTTNSSTFSPCSIREFERKIRNGKWKCMYDKPQVNGKLLPVILPGELLSLDEQCRRFNGTSACKTVDENICVNLSCYDKDRGECISNPVALAALDGTRCNNLSESKPKYCIANRCVEV